MIRETSFSKSYTQDMVDKLFLDTFLKNIVDYQNILKLSCSLLAFTSSKAFFLKKRGPELVLLSHFLHDF